MRLVKQLRAHLDQAHLHRTGPIDVLEITAEVTNLAIPAFMGNRLDGENDIAQQLSGPAHPHFKQMPAKCLPHLCIEQAQYTSFSKPKQTADLLRTHLERATALFNDLQEYPDACVHLRSQSANPATIRALSESLHTRATRRSELKARHCICAYSENALVRELPGA